MVTPHSCPKSGVSLYVAGATARGNVIEEALRVRFGIFIAPFHPRLGNVTLGYERDIELVQALDRLGYDEAWIGEHHSGGAQLIASPELFLAVLAERTRRIRLGAGVVSLPYHHPLDVVERMI